MALLVSSLPLSLTTIFGLPRSIISRSSSRATRVPESELSATSARHSRVQSSTTVRMRKRRPSVSWSETKSSDRIDGLQPVFYRLTAPPIELERKMASHGARAGLLIEPIEHINVVLMGAHALLADAVQAAFLDRLFCGVVFGGAQIRRPFHIGGAI